MASGNENEEQPKRFPGRGARGYATGARSGPVSSSAPSAAIRFVVAVHLVVDLALLVVPWQFTEPAIFLVLAWPMGQNALVAVWATRSGVSSYGRFAIFALGACATWFLAVGLLPDIAVYDRAAAAWALGFAAQSVLIGLGVATYRIVRRQIQRRQGAGGCATRRLQYTVGFLLVWTAVIALTLGLGKSALAELRWSGDVTGWPWFYHLPLIGSYNAVYALIVVASLAGRNRLALRVVVAGGLVAVLGWSEPYVLRSLFTTPKELTSRQSLILAGAQALYLYATLLPLRCHSAGRWQAALDNGRASR
jgi:hypothetical protein